MSKTENPSPQTKMTGDDSRLVWIIQNTAQVRVRDLALELMRDLRAAWPYQPDAKTPPQTNVFERGRPAAGVSRPSNNTREMTACEDASIADVPAGGYSSADENTLNYAQSEKYKPQTHLATSVDSRITGPVEEVSQGFSSVFAEANHRHALNGIGETGLHDDHSPAVIGLLDGAVVSGTFFSAHNADFESEDKRPALVRQGTGLLPDATHGTSEVESASVASTAPPENHTRLDVDRLAASIVTAACELDGPADPNGDNTISITMKDLEAVVHRHVTAVLESQS